MRERNDNQLQWGDNFDGIQDTWDNNDCGSGIQPSNGNWVYTYCDEPVEITNNFMDDRYAYLPGGYTTGQLNAAKGNICTHSNYLSDKADLFIWQEDFTTNVEWPTAAAYPFSWITTSGTMRFSSEETSYNATLLSEEIDLSNWSNLSLIVKFWQQDGKFTLKYVDVADNTEHTIVFHTLTSYLTNYVNTIALPQSCNGKVIKLLFQFEYHDNFYPCKTCCAESDMPCFEDTNTCGCSLVSSCATNKCKKGFFAQDRLEIDHLKIVGKYADYSLYTPTLNIACTTPTSASFQWQGQIPAAHYQVSYMEQGGTVWQELPQQTSESVWGTQDISGLLPGVTYTVRLRAFFDFCNTNSPTPDMQEYTTTFTTTTQTFVSGNVEVCAGETTTLTVNSPYNYFLWSNGSTAQSITVPAGVYSVTATDGVNNCTSITEVIVTEHPPFSVSLGEDETICPGFEPFPLMLTPYSTDFYIEWSTGTIDAPFITISSPGTYSLTVTDANGCTASATTTVVLFEPPTPQITMTQNECKVTLHATPPGFESYEWSNGLGNTPDVDVYAPGIY
ncbi:MAG TPA: fibronectin type III domain-containing protein, partial [Chitinophagales bacterium]|nr:fibronectin type III domain-containing protein [Chitinophagales bacterium]